MSELANRQTVAAARLRIDGHLPIEQYAAIGDSRTLALVGIDGSIDWMCLPDLDSPSVFAALLDPVRGGRFSLAPSGPFTAVRTYVPDTNVLRTDFTTAGGVVRVTDAVTTDTAQNAPWRELVREIEGISGSVPMEWHMCPGFDFGGHSSTPVHRNEQLVWRHGSLQMGLRSWSAGEARVDRSGGASAAFEMDSGRAALLALVASDGIALPVPDRRAIERRLQATIQLWREWAGRTSYDGPWKEAVVRSLLTLRLLADGRTGAIAAAGTTSLPEVIGGQRNFDYRFGWVRDLSFAVDALLSAGMDELAHASVGWLLEAAGRTAPRIDPVYTLAGEVVRSQRPLKLSGYRGSTPVLDGNGAGSQLQLGGFGDLLETVWRYAQADNILAPSAGERLADAVDLACALWRSEDSGLWELGERAHYATSKLGCWTALERLLDLVEDGQAPARHVERWRTERDRIREFIELHLWSDERRAYVMKAGSEMLDCGVLLAARRGFADPRGERIAGTIEAIRGELSAGGPLFYRYSGMPDEENAFLACSFWMAEALALAGRRDEAAEIMSGAVSLANDVGLYSEELDPATHELRGNFPQALTHLALVRAAATLGEQPDS